MKIILKEGQSPFENDDFVHGLQFVVVNKEVFVQIGRLSMRVEEKELRKVINLFS